MPDLKDFSKDPKTAQKAAAEARAEGKRATRRKPGEAPSGYDQDIWSLATEFSRLAWQDGITLVTDLPVIHDVLLELVDRWKMREQTYIQVTTGCKRRLLPPARADHCWLHTQDPGDGRITWVQMIEVIMAEFWSCWQDEHALDWFRQKFAEYGQMAVKHWQSLAMVNAIDARPREPRAIVRRKTTGATMPDDSKEGE